MKGRIVLGHMSGSLAGGQQVAERELVSALRRIAPPELRIDTVAFGSLRGGGGRRIPRRLLATAPYAALAPLGSVAYGRASVVHRLDTRCPPRLGREVLSILDLAPLRFPDEARLPRALIPAARRAAAVICPSTSTADDVRTMLGVERVHVVPLGVDAAPFRDAAPLTTEEHANLTGGARYVLYAGGSTQRKNLDALAAAWRRLGRADTWLLLVGPGRERRVQLFAGLDRVRDLGYVSDALVPRLVRAAAAVVIPSTYEGFGLPALEAMAAGTPVVAARTSSLVEVCGDAAQLAEPSAAGLAEALDAVLGDDGRARALAQAGAAHAGAFGWDETAQATLDVYREVLS